MRRNSNVRGDSSRRARLRGQQAAAARTGSDTASRLQALAPFAAPENGGHEERRGGGGYEEGEAIRADAKRPAGAAERCDPEEQQPVAYPGKQDEVTQGRASAHLAECRQRDPSRCAQDRAGRDGQHPPVPECRQPCRPDEAAEREEKGRDPDEKRGDDENARSDAGTPPGGGSSQVRIKMAWSSATTTIAPARMATRPARRGAGT